MALRAVCFAAGRFLGFLGQGASSASRAFAAAGSGAGPKGRGTGAREGASAKVGLFGVGGRRQRDAGDAQAGLSKKGSPFFLEAGCGREDCARRSWAVCKSIARKAEKLPASKQSELGVVCASRRGGKSNRIQGRGHMRIRIKAYGKSGAKWEARLRQAYGKRGMAMAAAALADGGLGTAAWVSPAAGKGQREALEDLRGLCVRDPAGGLEVLMALDGWSEHPALAFNCGRMLSAAGKHAQAREKYAKALGMDPGMGDAARGWAQSELAMGNAQEALGILARAWKDTGDWGVRLALAGALAGAGKAGEALRHFRAARLARPQNALAWLGEGMCLESLGGEENQAQAQAALARAFELGAGGG